MTTKPSAVAVVATNVAGSDRRALSQAWYSALHLAERARSEPPSQARRASGVHTGPGPRERDRGADAPHAPHAAQRVPARAGSTATITGVLERRAPASELARRIERALVHRPPATSASIAIAGAGGRVHVLLRIGNGTTRIVALCAPQLKERVERALAQARFALAASGRPIAGA